MKRPFIFIFAFVVAGGFLSRSPAATKSAAGFEGATFGQSRAETMDAVMKTLQIVRVQAFSGVDFRGPNGLRLMEQDDALLLQGYRLNGRRMDVELLFNSNDRFFRFQYEAQRRAPSYFESAIKDDALFLSREFQKRYGSPSFRMDPKAVELRPGGRGYFWRWTKNRDTIYTAIAAGEYDFGAIGVVSDDALQRQTPEARPAATLPEPAVELETPTFDAVSPSPEPFPSPWVDPSPIPTPAP